MLPEPTNTATVRDDVGNRLAVDRQRDLLTGLDRVDYLTRAIPQIPNTHLHVRQRSTNGGQPRRRPSVCHQRR